MRTASDFGGREVSSLFATRTGNDDRAIQSAKAECDINEIVRRFGLTKVLPATPLPPTYADFTEAGDFRESMEVIRLAREAFEALPAGVRYKFGNDPAAFVDFCENPDNIEEMREMGLAVPAPPEVVREPQEVRIVGDERSASDSGDKK